MTIGLSLNRCSHSKKNQFDEREQDWLVQKFGLRRPQTKGGFARRVLGVEHTIAIAILGPNIRGLAAFFGDL